MNADRRKRINDIVSTLEQLHADIEAIRDEEQESFDNTPESLQQSEKGQKSEEAISTLEDVASEIENAKDNLAGIE